MCANICRTAYVDLKDKVEIHGVTRAKYRGLPRSFIQQEDTEKLNKARAIGATYAVRQILAHMNKLSRYHM